MEVTFDAEAAIEQLRNGANLGGKNGVLTPLIKQLIEATLEGELEAHLVEEARQGKANRRNGKSGKKLKTTDGVIHLETPRDRGGSFEPQIVKKHQSSLGDEIEEKILALYALGNSYRQISEHLEDLYGCALSNGTIGTVTDTLIPQLQEWRQRPLERCYPVVWLDAIHYKIKDEGRYVQKAVYTVLGMSIEGKKEVLGLYLSESEGAKFWLSVLTDLNQRGIEDILITCVDGLSGFPEAIQSVFPKAQVQLCIVHQIRNSLKYVASKDQKAFMADLKPVYKAINKEAAEEALLKLDETWGSKYPIVLRSWTEKWERLSNYFQYPEAIRRIIYTTNIIESVHRQFRKLTKSKGAFPNENSLLKLLYVGIMNAQKKWTMPVHNWGQSLSQLAIFFEGRIETHIHL